MGEGEIRSRGRENKEWGRERYGVEGERIKSGGGGKGRSRGRENEE